MSGRDETSVPPETEGAEPPPYPQTPAPPSFGHSAPAENPLVIFQAADAPAGSRIFTGKLTTPDAEETMTSPRPRPGSTVPEAEKTTPAPPSSYGPATATPGTHRDPMAPDGGVPAAEHTTVDTPDQATADAEKTTALARFGDGEPAGPELTPDAILPPGTAPQEEEEPAHDEGTKTGPIPRLGPGATFPADGPYPGGPGMPPYDGGRRHGEDGPFGTRTALLAGGGVLGVLLLGGAIILGYTSLSGGPSKEHAVAQSTSPTKPTPARTRAKHRPRPKPVRNDIRDERKDPEPLTIPEVFPHRSVRAAGHTFVIAKAVVNDHCDLTASRPFADQLIRQHCRRVVRATFVSTDKSLAVTTGIAVMPTDAAAVAVLKTQDPAHYRWFRGMKATGAPKIDSAGGFAASTLRGRYISFAYVAYADGHKPKKGDKTLKAVGTAFRDSTAEPIERRAKGTH